MKIRTYVKFIIELTLSKREIATDSYKSIYKIPFSRLSNRYSLIIFDHDDTLTDHLGELSTRTQDVLKQLPEMGFKLAVYSNCSNKQTQNLKDTFVNSEIYVVKRSDKPDPAGFIEVMDHFHISPGKTIMIGDRLGTDIYGAYQAKIKKRILVNNFSIVFGGNRPNIFLKFFGWLERVIYFKTRTNKINSHSS